jgi:centrosomal protein CEP104
MLAICTECKQVVEISSLHEHLLDECEKKQSFRPCPKCGEALHSREYNSHVGSCAARGPSGPRCALCHADVDDDEEGWRRHLLDDGCPANPRTH